MSADALKLTSYFGERDRSGHRLVADALLALYGERAINTSVLIRGIGGFGVRHALSTDRLLSSSEDLPVVSVALDTRARIEAVLPAVRAIGRGGLLTIERARFVSGQSMAEEPQPAQAGRQQKLTVYCGRRDRVAGSPAFVSICATLAERGLSGATVLLGVDGTRGGTRTRARFFGHNADVPLMVITVGDGAEILDVAGAVSARLPDATVTLERIQVCKRDGKLLGRPELTGYDGGWAKLMVHSSEAAQYRGHPLHRILVSRLRDAGVLGGISLRGIWGFHGEHPPHGDRLLAMARHVPVLTVVVDEPDRIDRAFDVVDELTAERGLVTCEFVPTALRLAQP